MREQLRTFLDKITSRFQEELERQAKEAGVLQAGDQLTFSVNHQQVPVVLNRSKPIRATGRYGNVTYLPDDLTPDNFREILSHNYQGRTPGIIHIFEQAGGAPVAHTTFNEAFNETNFHTEGKFEGVNNAFRNHGFPFRVRAVLEKNGVKFFRICRIQGRNMRRKT